MKPAPLLIGPLPFDRGKIGRIGGQPTGCEIKVCIGTEILASWRG